MQSNEDRQRHSETKTDAIAQWRLAMDQVGTMEPTCRCRSRAGNPLVRRYKDEIANFLNCVHWRSRHRMYLSQFRR